MIRIIGQTDRYRQFVIGWPADDDDHCIEPPGSLLVTKIWDEETDEHQGVGIHRTAAPDWPNDEAWRASIHLTLSQAHKLRDVLNLMLGE